MDELPKEHIAPKEALDAIAQGAILIDVRTQKEFDEGHLLGAKLMPHDMIAEKLKSLSEYKTKKIILYCKSGGRSQFATEILRAAGFKDSWNAGGYKELVTFTDSKNIISEYFSGND